MSVWTKNLLLEYPYDMNEVKINQLWILLSVIVCVLVAGASAAGIFVKSIDSQEMATYAAQGIGQDIVNIIVAVPALLVSAYFLSKRSVRALLVWLGARDLPRGAGIHVDATVLAFNAAVAILTGLVFGSGSAVATNGFRMSTGPVKSIQTFCQIPMFRSGTVIIQSYPIVMISVTSRINSDW
jgi:hypothetical protein